MFILGINCVYHESAVALLKVNAGKWELVSFVEEERFNRKKRAKAALIDNCHVLPVRSLKWTLKQAGIRMDEIDHVATSINPEKRKTKNIGHIHDYPLTENSFGTLSGELRFKESALNIETRLRDLGFAGEFHFLNHHDCHSASAYYVSGFEEAASIVIDGIGEFESTSIFDCKGKEQKLVRNIDYPNSLGFLWEKMSEFVGFTEYDAGKVMGMSAFGGRKILEERFNLLCQQHETGFEVNDKLVRFRCKDMSAIENVLGIPRSTEKITDLNYSTLIYFDLAATLQDYTEKVVLDLVKSAKALTGKNKLCISGGVALNCVANQKIMEADLFDEIFIQPAANDAGTAMGAAMIIAQQHIDKFEAPKATLSPYTKVAFDEKEYLKALSKHSSIQYTRSEDIYTDTANIVASGGIIAWFRGGMEYGPRALGHRSIIADPRNLHTLKKINEHVKLREIFRPLAPVILKEKTQEWFDIEDKWIEQLNSPYLYMLATAGVVPEKRHLIPSVVHYDNTSRVQIVDKNLSPDFYRLIEVFDQITGVPILTNTSFNIQEPIVCSPNDAIKTFLRSSMAALILGDYIVTKNLLHPSNLKHGKISQKNNAKVSALIG